PVVRFKILTQQVEVAKMQSSACEVYAYNNNLRVQNFTESNGRVIVYDFSGKMIAMKNINAVENLSMPLQKNATYIVKSVIGNKTEIKKILIK
ncbi:MAG: T9SS type A sorting domain-containing protein, partial [Paludibacter sp.]|nr:T9SS type A sorting domain-containing protein [Paludibacter sp.]